MLRLTQPPSCCCTVNFEYFQVTSAHTPCPLLLPMQAEDVGHVRAHCVALLQQLQAEHLVFEDRFVVLCVSTGGHACL
jgi:hypothetical protein